VNKDEFRFPDACKDPAEYLKVELECYSWCANRWRPNEQYSAGEFVRPRRPNGFAYECTTAGLSGDREPIWNRVIDALGPVDGSAQWTCRAAGSNGLMPISAPSAQSDPSGLTISDVAISESTKILATYSGGSLDQDHDVVFTFTLNGVARVARQVVKIRKR